MSIEANLPQIDASTPSYVQIPPFGKLGKIVVDAAPEGSGRNALAFLPTASGSAASSAPVPSGTGTGTGTGGGGFNPAVPIITDTPNSYGTVVLTVCVNGHPQLFRFLGSRI